MGVHIGTEAGMRRAVGRPWRAGITVILTVLLPTIFGFVGCSEPFEPPENGDPPHAEIDIRFLDYVNEGYTFTHFDCNPLNCSDDRTNRSHLELRWDFEDDGTWDTDFAPLEFMDDVLPSPLPLPGDLWRVRCEVRDEDGLVSVGTDTVRMPDTTPRSPDIVARRAVVDTIEDGWSSTDTVRVGQDFFVMLTSLRWLDIGEYESFDYELLIDDVPVTTWWQIPEANLRFGIRYPENSQFYGNAYRIDEPGIHTLTVRVDINDTVAETDETNNSFTRELVVIP